MHHQKQCKINYTKVCLLIFDQSLHSNVITCTELVFIEHNTLLAYLIVKSGLDLHRPDGVLYPSQVGKDSGVYGRGPL